MSLPLQPQLEKEIIDQNNLGLIDSNADVAKLVDALDLGSSAARHGGSSPSIRTASSPQSLHCFRSTGKRLGVFSSPSV